MQEVVHRCDMVIGKLGNVCGERVPDDVSTTFSLGRESYAIDLCEKHKDKLGDCLQPFIAQAHVEQRGNMTKKTVRSVLRGKGGTFTTKQVREWLQDQGREVAPSGRLPQHLIEEYKEAHV